MGDATNFYQHRTEDAIDPAPIPFTPVESVITQPSALVSLEPTSPNRHQVADTFAPVVDADLSGLSSNDEVLAVLRNLDMERIINVLETTGGAANTPSMSGASLVRDHDLIPPQHIQVHLRPPCPRVNTIDDASQSEQCGLSDHAYTLSNKWLTAAQLAKLAIEEGLIFKKGKFSASEGIQISDAIAKYQADRGLTCEELRQLIFPAKGQAKDAFFWSQITSAVPLRPIVAVYHHVRRQWHPYNKGGPWTERQDKLLEEAVADLGTRWEKVSKRVTRMPADCRDRYRNYILGKDKRQSGPWSTDEENDLLKIMMNMDSTQARNSDDDAFWAKVSDMMNGRRGRQQCRMKWIDSLSKMTKVTGRKPRWDQQDSFVLFHKVASLSVNDDTEIDWKTLQDPNWNLWSAHEIQRRWVSLKRGVDGWEQLTHSEILNELRPRMAPLRLHL